MQAVPDDGLFVGDLLMSLARRHGLTTYDAQYLQLAVTRHAHLVRRDKALREAPQDEGVSLWSPSSHL